MPHHDRRRNVAIQKYFNEGYSYKNILRLLQRLGIVISMRKLKRILFSLGLARRKPNCSLAHVCDTLMTEIQGSGSLLGYRCMHQKLRVIHNIQISRNNVMNLQKAIDPIGVAERRARKLKRRRYITPGPNYLWHLDGYDKLKRYGICIHGCIDGYSRKLIWLEAASTNNCPAVVAGFFLNQVKSLKGTALNVRADRGTENSNIAGIQRLFRSNDNDFQAIEKSFRFGRSTSNQVNSILYLKYFLVFRQCRFTKNTFNMNV
ncbi:uncharacterized protein [Clytia hemisphaerica]